MANPQFKEKLAQDRSDRSAETAAIIKRTKGLVEGFAQSRRDSLLRLKEDLKEASVCRKADVNKTLSDARNTLSAFKENRAKSMADFNAKLSAARDRTRSTVTGLTGQTQALLTGLEKTTGEQEVGLDSNSNRKIPEPGGHRDFESKLMDIINQHWEGISLTDAAAALGIVPIVLGRASKKLLEDGKARKVEKLYFPGEQI